MGGRARTRRRKNGYRSDCQNLRTELGGFCVWGGFHLMLEHCRWCGFRALQRVGAVCASTPGHSAGGVNLRPLRIAVDTWWMSGLPLRMHTKCDVRVQRILSASCRTHTHTHAHTHTRRMPRRHTHRKYTSTCQTVLSFPVHCVHHSYTSQFGGSSRGEERRAVWLTNGHGTPGGVAYVDSGGVLTSNADAL